MSPRVRRAGVGHRPGLLLIALLLLGLGAARAEDETLPVLRRKVLEAREEDQIAHALDRLTAHVGEERFYADHAAFGDWLGTLPDGRADHPLVRLRRGWAYVRAKRGADALPHLEAAVADDPGSGLARAYLGEALRQVGRHAEAAAMLTAAARCGERGKHLEESFRETVFALRAGEIAGHADDLPEYVKAVEAWLQVVPDALWHHALARMLLDDVATYERPDRERGKLWARTAGRHALAALESDAEPIAGADTLAYDAAVALEALDLELEGRTERFDLLAWADRLGVMPSQDSHRFPQVLTWLAEAAAREERFELAFRLAQRRLAVSESPRVRRLLMRLPPDLDSE